MPIDHKTLRQRMVKAQAEGRDRCKGIMFPLPDLRGPKGNAFWLLGEAENLMKQADIPEGIRSQFQQEAKSGDYQHLLGTIRQWFTLVVPKVTYDVLPEDAPLPLPERFDSDDEDYDEEVEFCNYNVENDRPCNLDKGHEGPHRDMKGRTIRSPKGCPVAGCKEPGEHTHGTDA